MADNRNFVNKFANEGGGDIFVEDAKLSESTSTTTVTTEGVLLKGTDGAFYEIDKTSLSEVIRAELGAILADNSKNNGTSVAKVPTLNSTGNALGASSVADFASVMGVGTDYISLSSGQSFNSVPYTSGYYLVDAEPGVTDAPITITESVTLFVKNTGAKVQLGTLRYLQEVSIKKRQSNELIGVYARWCGAGSVGEEGPWIREDNFGCNTAADLASLLDMVVDFDTPTTTKDLNSYKTNVGVTVYAAGAHSTNAPSDSGNAQNIVINIFTASKYGVQFYHGRNSYNWWFRNCENDTWSSWKSIAFATT